MMRRKIWPGLILLVACKQPELEPIPTPPPSGHIDIQAWGARFGIDDYKGLYSVNADLDVEYDTGEALFDAFVVEIPNPFVWYEYNSVGSLTHLNIRWLPERDVDGWPAYSIQSSAYIDAYDITVTIDGVMYLESYNAELNEVLYDYDGMITLNMFGEEMSVEDGVYYQDPGEFVGEVHAWSRNMVVEP